MRKLKLHACELNPVVGDLKRNFAEIQRVYENAKTAGADIAVFPELALPGYCPADMIFYRHFQDEIMLQNNALAAITDENTALLFGTAWIEKGVIYNAAAFAHSGKIQHVSFKTDLPQHNVFDEKRHFTPAPKRQVFEFKGVKIGVPICYDSWHADICTELANLGAEVLLIPNGSPYYHGKHLHRFDFISKRANETGLPILYLNLCGGQEHVVFDGRSFSMNPGSLASNVQTPWVTNNVFELHLTESEQQKMVFEEKTFAADGWDLKEQDIYAALKLGLRDYMHKNGFEDVVLGLSGGVDSALVAALAADALGPQHVHGVRLPSKYSSDHSMEDAATLAKNLGIHLHTLPIEDIVTTERSAFAKAYGKQAEGLTDENLQARTRGLMLMAFTNARPKTLLLATGNKSEMAVGYCTLYGDMSGGFAPIKDVYKTEVYNLCYWRNEQSAVIPENILAKSPSAELRADQKDQDNLPDYTILDDILSLYIDHLQSPEAIIAAGHDEQTVRKSLNMLQSTEYKRFQAPPGTKVTLTSFGPDWRWPLTNHMKI